MISSPALLEREVNLAAVTRLLDAAEGGRGGALFLIGESGVGKTSLLDAAQEHAGERFRVGRGQADSLDALLPYRLLREAFTAVDRDAPVGAAATAPNPGSDARASLFYGALRWVEETSASAPLLVLLDDLHWADADSLALVGLICRRLSALSAALLCSLRPWPTGAEETARGLLRERLAGIERLEPLGRQSAISLLRERAGDLEGGLVHRAWELSAGNPLLLEQAAAIIRRHGGLPAVGGGGHDLLVSRFAGVSSDALRLARAASILGLRFRCGVASELAQLDEPATDAALEALAIAGLVREQEPGCAAFVHPLFRQSMYEDIEPPLRARLHARAFRLLSRLGVDAAETAEQALLADLAGDADAVTALERAGRLALRAGANAAAVRHLRGALRLAGDAAHPALRMARAEAELVSGEAAIAVQECDHLLADRHLDAGRRVDIQRLRGRAHFYLGHLPEADADFGAALRGSGGGHPDIAVEVGLEFATVVMFAAGPSRALPLMAQARDLGDKASEPVQAAAELGWAITSVLSGDPAGCGAAAAEAARMLVRGRHTDRAGSLAFFGNAAATLELFDEAESTFATALEWTERLGDPVIMSLVAASWAAVALRRGILGTAVDLVGRALDLLDLAPGARTFSQAVASVVLLEAGQRRRSEEVAASAADLVQARGEWMPALWLRFGQLRRHLDDGRGAEAAGDAEWLVATAQRFGVAEPCFVPWGRDALAALVSAGRLDAAKTLIDDLTVAGARLPCRWPRAVLGHGRALLAERAGDLETAEREHLGSLDLLAGAGLELERARGLLDAGAMLRRAGQPVRARPLLAEALAVAETAGGVRLAAAAVAELQIAGGRRRRRSGGSELTAAEERVARLAVEGLSNTEIAVRLFVSAKTVDTHLQHIYSKLGVNSRRELMRRGLSHDS